MIRSFSANAARQTLTQVAQRSALSRAGAQRILLTLESLGYVATDGKLFSLTPRILGWCMVNQELEEGPASMAAPITNRAGQTVTALNISGQANRTSAKAMQKIMLPHLLAAA